MTYRPILTLLLAAATVPATFAQPMSFAAQSVEIHVGTVLIEGQRANGVTANWAPHAWHNLDRDRAVKPASWSLTNPMGQTTLTADAHARWTALTGSAPPVGSRVSKRDAPFWEVPLATTSLATISQFQVLLLPIRESLQLNSMERERLRAFVDQGGVLWIDIQGSPVIDFANVGPLGFALATSTAPLMTDPTHPLLNTPHALSIDDLARMTDPASATVTTLMDLSASPLSRVLATLAAESAQLDGVVGNAAGRTISVGRIGAGHVVVTARGVSSALNRGIDRSVTPAQLSANLGFSALEGADDAVSASAAKFAVNLVTLGGRFASDGANSRKTNSTSVAVQVPVLRRFGVSFEPNSFRAGRPAVVFNGFIVAATAAGRLAVMDAKPDERMQVLTGLPGDVLWTHEAGNPLSSPTVVSVPSTVLASALGGPALNQIWVTNSLGQVLVFELETGALLQTISPPSASQPDPDGPHAPTVHEGMAFVVDRRSFDGLGRVWAIDLNQAQRIATDADWAVQGSGRLAPPSSSATVGYIPIMDNSGGMDRVVYVPTANSTVSPVRPAGLASVWVGAKGEAPHRVDMVGPNEVRLYTRAHLNGLPVVVSGDQSPLGIRITILKPNGDPFTFAELQAHLTGAIREGSNGEIIVTVTGSGWDWTGNMTPQATDDVAWRLDYTIDWGRVGGVGAPPDNFVRGNLEFPDTGANTRRVLGSPALGNDGMLFVVTAPPSGPGGTLFALREEGRGDFRLTYRWDLHEALEMRLNQATGAADSVTVPEAVIDEDPLTREFTFLQSPMRNLRFTAPPAVRGDTVFLTAVGNKTVFGFPAPTTALLAFRASMPPVEFEISGPLRGIQLVQPDVARSVNKTVPEVFSNLSRAQFTLERIGEERARVLIRNMAESTRGRIADSLTTSLPILIRREGQTDVVVQPEAAANSGRFVAGMARGKFNPLRWYTVINGLNPTAAPLVTGRTVFVGGSSVLPALTATGFSSIAFNGLMYAFDTEISANDPFLQPNSVRPWVSQLYQIRIDAGNWQSAPAVRWPSFGGIRDFDDYRIRLLQASLPLDTAVRNMAGGEDILVVTGPNNLYAFSRVELLVVDEGRVSRFDPTGLPIWSTDMTLSGGLDRPTGGATVSRTFSAPNRAYPAGDGTMWVVDTGNDRVIRIDGAGRELRSISRLKVHPTRVPDGFVSSGSLNLRRPLDMLSYTTRRTPAEVSAAFPGENNPDGIGPEMWVHTVIADAGNSRIVELVDRYRLDPTSGRVMGLVRYIDPQSTSPGGVEFATGVLFWHTPSQLTGRGFAYSSVDRLILGVGATRREVYAFGFGNTEPGRATFGLDPTNQDLSQATGLGGIVVFDAQNTAVITRVLVPDIPANTFLVQTGPGQFGFGSGARQAQEKTISGLTSVTTRFVETPSGLRLAVMFTDNTGVWEVYQPVEGPDQPWVVRWALPMDAFVGMRRPRGNGPFSVGDLDRNPQRFEPTFARRLESGDVLLVNRYFGRYVGGSPYFGEVVLIDGRIGGTGENPGFDFSRPNLGFNRLSVQYELPPVQGIRGLVRPVSAVRN